jgi:hypothetical protein
VVASRVELLSGGGVQARGEPSNRGEKIGAPPAQRMSSIHKRTSPMRPLNDHTVDAFCAATTAERSLTVAMATPAIVPHVAAKSTMHAFCAANMPKTPLENCALPPLIACNASLPPIAMSPPVASAVETSACGLTET